MNHNVNMRTSVASTRLYPIFDENHKIPARRVRNSFRNTARRRKFGVAECLGNIDVMRREEKYEGRTAITGVKKASRTFRYCHDGVFTLTGGTGSESADVRPPINRVTSPARVHAHAERLYRPPRRRTARALSFIFGWAGRRTRASNDREVPLPEFRMLLDGHMSLWADKRRTRLYRPLSLVIFFGSIKDSAILSALRLLCFHSITIISNLTPPVKISHYRNKETF